jgi:hypothetical protein
MSEKVELELYVEGETAMAYAVTEGEPDSPTIWLPKSQVDVLGRSTLGSVATFEVPEWLAVEKGLV